MKYIAKILIALVALQTNICLGTMIIAEFKVDVTLSPNITERVVAHIASDKQPYTAGGLVFTYPTGLFAAPPTIRISVENDLALPIDTKTYVALINANSSTSATIIVHKIVNSSLGVTDITEASTGEVTIHFVAAGL